MLDCIIPGNSNYFMTFQDLLLWNDLRGALEGLMQSRPWNKLVETYSNSSIYQNKPFFLKIIQTDNTKVWFKRNFHDLKKCLRKNIFIFYTTNICLCSSRVLYDCDDHQHVELNNHKFSILLQSLRVFLKHLFVVYRTLLN